MGGLSTESLEDLCELALDLGLKLGSSYVEARAQLEEASTLIVKNGNVEAYTTSTLNGLGIRVIVEGVLGFASLNEPDKNLLEETVRSAIGMARGARNAERVGLSWEESVKASWGKREKIAFEDVPLKDKVSLLLDLDKSIASLPRAVPARLFELIELRTRKYFVNSEGSELRGYVPRLLAIGTMTAVKNGDSEQMVVERGECGGWEVMERIRFDEECIEKASALGKILEEARGAPREIDLVLGSEIVGLAVHESAGHPHEADRILGRESAQAGESFLTRDSLGMQLGSKLVTVVDDPTLERSFGFYSHDDEGVPAKARFLVKEGRVNEFLHNRETAAALGTDSNASARASDFAKEPIVRMGNTYLAPGDYEFDELIEDVRNGVYVKTFMEWNIDDLRYNMKFVGCEAYSIERGELSHMIRRPVVELTTPAFYGGIDALTRDVSFCAAICGKGDPGQMIPVWTGGPTIRLRGIKLGAS